MAVLGRKAVFIILGPVYTMRASLEAQMVKNLRATWETWVGPLGREDPLEKEMTTHSNILAWRVSWTEKTDDGSDLACMHTHVYVSLSNMQSDNVI